MAKGRPSSRERILKAAEALVAECGAQQLTYEALAQRCGVSRGGILYNFPSKQELLQALVDGYIERLRAHAEELLAAADGGDSVARGRAYAQVLLERVDEDRDTCTALLAAVVENRALLSPYRRQVEEALTALGAAAPKHADGALLFFALEGMRLFKTLNLYPLDAAQDQALKARLAGLLEEPHDP